MFKSLLRGILAIACCGIASAQVVQDFAPTKGVGYQSQWQKRIGTANIKAMSGTSDGGMFVAGGAPGDSSDLDVWVARFSVDGLLVWQHRFGKDGTEGAAALAQTSDGGVAVVGTSSTFPPGFSIYLIKLSSKGDLDWQRVIDSGTGFEFISSMAETEDGGLILVGTTSNTSSSSDIWALKLDAAGRTIWEKTYGTTNGESGRGVGVEKYGDIIITADGGTGPNPDVIVFKIDESGNILWQSKFDGTNFGQGTQADRAYSLDVFPQGGCVVAADTSRASANMHSDVVIRFDADGKSPWRSYLGSPVESGVNGMGISTTADGGYLFGGGWSSSSPTGPWIVRGSPGGDVVEGDCTAVTVDHTTYEPGTITLTTTNVSSSNTEVVTAPKPHTANPSDWSQLQTTRCEGAGTWSRTYTSGGTTFRAITRTADGGAAFAYDFYLGGTFVIKLGGPRQSPPERILYGGDPGVRLGGNTNISTGDFTKDGWPDLLLGAAAADGPNNARTDCGEAYVISETSLRDRDLRRPGDAAVRFRGASAGDALGFSTAAGDLNGDGYPDMILGAPGRDTGGTDAGEVAVFFGTPSIDIDLATVSPDIRITGSVTGGGVGRALAVGDLNGDGHPDLVIGAPADSSSPGRVYVFYGPIAPGNYSTSAANVTVLGRDNGDALGTLVAVGNVNGTTGSQDLLASAPTADAVGNAKANAGEIYILFGGALPATYNLATTAPNYEIIGADAGDQLGFGLAAGDVSNDGIADIAVGAQFADGNSNARSNAGEVYVKFGSTTLSGTLNLASGSANLRIIGGRAGDNLGSGLAIADVNNQSPADLILGASGGDGPTGTTRTDAGEVDILRGPLSGPPTLDLFSYRPSLAFHGVDASDKMGSWVAAGDVTGDGVLDLLMAANGGDGPNDARSNAGEVIVVNGFVTPAFSQCTSPNGSFTGYHLVYPYACSILPKPPNAPLLYASGGSEGASCAIADAPGTGSNVCLGDPDGDGQEEVVLYFDNACLTSLGWPNATLYELMANAQSPWQQKLLFPIPGLQLNCDEE